MKKRAHLIVSGKVQGVFYRAYVRECALRHKVTGWVRNLRDGRVEALLEGEEQHIEDLIKELWQGSPSSRVDDIKIHLGDYKGEYSGFSGSVNFSGAGKRQT